MCDGGLTERILLPSRKLHPAGRLTPEQCALVETLAIGCHAVDRAHSQRGENVLIIGAGPIGLSALEFAKLSGARTIVMDIAESRLAFVRERMGVPDTIVARGDESDIKTVAELTNGQFADVVIDATGNSRSMVRAMEFAAFAGRVVYVGITQQNLKFPHAPFLHRRELTLLASRNALSRDFSRIVRLIEDGEIDTRPWITHYAAFDEVPEVFPSWLKPETGVIKAVVEVS
jgi:alcohol dehydrogenase